MADTRRMTSRRMSMLVAFCGVSAGLSAVIMLLGGVLQIATFAAPLMAGLLLLPVRVEFGGKAAWGTWAVTAALSLLLGLDKESAFFYVFLGWWPIVKFSVDMRLKKPGLRFLMKLVFFAASIAGMYAILFFAVGLPELKEELQTASAVASAAFLVMGVICMLLYDFLLKPLSVIYAVRVRPKLTFLRRNG